MIDGEILEHFDNVSKRYPKLTLTFDVCFSADLLLGILAPEIVLWSPIASPLGSSGVLAVWVSQATYYVSVAVLQGHRLRVQHRVAVPVADAFVLYCRKSLAINWNG